MSLPGKTLPMLKSVLRPIMQACPIVKALNRDKSSGSVHNKELLSPMAPSVEDASSSPMDLDETKSVIAND
jgi:hypothetical protein